MWNDLIFLNVIFCIICFLLQCIEIGRNAVLIHGVNTEKICGYPAFLGYLFLFKFTFVTIYSPLNDMEEIILGY